MTKPRRRLQDWMRSLGKPEPTPEPLFAPRTPAFDIMQRPGSDDSDVEWSKMDAQMRARYSNAPILLEDHERPHRDQALSAATITALRSADDRATAGMSATIANQQQLEKDVLSRALAALPRAMQLMVEESRAALEQAEKELGEKTLRLLGLDSTDDSGIYAARHSQLTSGIDALDDLVQDRQGDYRRLIERVADRLDAVLDMHERQSAQAHQEARARYAALQAEARAELGRLAGVRGAIGRVRSALEDAQPAERAIGGRAVTPDAPRIDRVAEREARQLVALQIRAK